ncbi:amidase domain-containing protein [Microbacterium sp. Marseille-Q6965]|uniref:amidase domain-containing protein n=1 Tax=Microbacterium sp. Marseille-Q6965 TaxID=2965072 RepID=UPI0021B7DE13|nr:amidase domain-containing protein [Microbacterium sp. Marseille-Q6965]
MSDNAFTPSSRASARRARRRRARRRGVLVLGGGAAVLVWGASALVGALTSVGEGGVAQAASVQASIEQRPARTTSDGTTPRVAALSAAAGSLAGGESVTITGTGLAGVTRVSFGTADAEIAEARDDAVTVIAPSAVDYVAGEVPVTVHAASVPVKGTSTLRYSYEARTGVDRQLQYALAHWDDYNDEQWGDYNPIGGDCMNFVSQTLVARGWAQRDDWYHDGASSTETWRFVPTFDAWITEHARELGVTRLGLDQRDQVKLGDLVVFDWDADGTLDHIQLVSDLDRNADGSVAIRMAGHNLDSNYRDLDHALTVEHPGSTAHFWSLPDA